MPIYDYQAKDRKNETTAGAVEAITENMAADLLKERGLIVVSLAERQVGGSFFKSLFGFLHKVPARDVVIFSRQLAVMISAQIPIVQALKILVRQTENVTFKMVISEIADEVDGGSKLSQSLGRHPQVFNNFFIHMIRSGETTGKLDDTLEYLAKQTEKDYELNSKIKGAMIYPAFILGGLLLVGLVMMIFVIPKLTAILTESGAKLPLSTKLLIGTSNVLQHQWWLLLLIIIVLFFSYRLYARSEKGRETIDIIKFKFPVFGSLYKKIYLTRFSQSLSTLIVGGIPLTRSLEIVADVVGNRIYKDLTLKTIKEVEDGNSISTVFVKSKYIPPMLSQMMNVGERVGRLDTVLDKLAEFYAKEIEMSISNLVSLIEPLVMVVLGVGVAIMVMAILMPIYNMSSTI